MATGLAASGMGKPASADGVRRADVAWVTVASGAAIALAVIATWKGPGLTQDSVGYLSTGTNVARGHGLRMLADQPLTVFPPGLPLVAGLGEVIGLGAATTLRWVSILSFGAIVALGHALLQRAVPHRGVVVASTLLLAGSPVLLGVSKMAWSEPPFIVVTLLLLLVLGRVWERASLTRVDFIELTILGGVAFLLRYIGFAVIVAAGLAMLYALRPRGWSVVRQAAAFGAASAVVPIACMLRNHAADGSYLGNRLASHDSVREVTVRTAATIGSWVLPMRGVATRPAAMVGGVAALLAIVGLVLIARAGASNGPRADESGGAGARALLACCALFVVVYGIYLTGAAVNTAFEPTNSRYLSPIYVPALAVVAAGVAMALRRIPTTAWRGLLAVVLAGAVVGQVTVSIRDAGDAARDGVGFSSPGWTGSPLAAVAARVVKSAADPPVLYSNNPNALWAATRLQPIHFAPRDEAFRGIRAVGELEAFVRDVACTRSTSYLVFYLLGDERVVSLATIKAALDVKPVAAASDGVLLRVTAPPRRSCLDAPPGPTRVP